jgi:hypothetical protein
MSQMPPSPQSSRRIQLWAEGYAATIEIQPTSDGEGEQSYWWVSGPTASKRIGLLAQMTLSNIPLEEDELQYLFASHVLPIVRLNQGAIIDLVFQRKQVEVEQVLLAHVAAHSRILSEDANSLMERTAALYQMVNSFGLNRVIEFMSRVEGTQVNTIKKRVSLARQAGRLPRLRASRTGSYELDTNA